VFDNIEKHIDRMVSGEIAISNQNSNREEQTQGQNNEVKPCSQTEPDSSGRMYNNNVATSKDNEAYVAGGLLFTKKGTLVAVLGFSGVYLLPLCFSLGTILVV
jgi:hypothetical protein